MNVVVTPNPHNILRTCDFDPKKLIVTESTKTKYGGLQSFLNYPMKGSAGKVIYQTPKMVAPFGIVKSQMKEDEEPKYYLELSFNATTDKLEGFHKRARDIFVGIDDKLVEVAADRSGEWFKKKKDKQWVLEEKYKSCLRANLDEDRKPKYDYPDRLNFKILVNDDGKPALEVYDHQRKRIPVNSIDELKNVVTNGRKVKAIVQASTVWITSTGCGVSWRVVMIKVYPKEQLDEYAFHDSDDDAEVME